MISRCALLIGGADSNDVGSLLIENGFQVETAVSTSDLAKAAMELQFLLVFVYLDMPEMLDCVKRLRRTSKNRKTPLIGLIRDQEKDSYDEIACLKAGINDYLTLPVVPERFALVLRRWIA